MDLTGANGARAISLAFALLLLALPAAAQTSRSVPETMEEAHRSFAPLVERAAPAVVNIYARKIVPGRSPLALLDSSAFWRLFRDTLLFGYGRERAENALGSGVVVRADGVIVTNHHVVEAADGIVVALADGRSFAARILVSDKRTDLAVLKIDAGPEPLPILEFGDSDRLKVGDIVLAIGNPFGLGQTVTSGIVSALARSSIGIGDFRFFIQTDAAINPGNSGGAQIAMDGKLVGINTAIYGSGQGLGFAVPSNMVRTVVEMTLRGLPLVRPWIGVSGRRVPPQFAAGLGLPPARGVLVTGLYDGGPAERAGLAVGDVILLMGDFPVNEPQALRYRIATRIVGDSLDLTVMRNGTPRAVTVVAEAPPTEPPRDDRRLSGLHPLSGATIAGLSPAFAEELGVDSAIAGIVVLEVGPGSAADRLSLQPGDVIRALDDKPLHTSAELADLDIKPFSRWRLIVTRGGQEIALGPAP